MFSLGVKVENGLDQFQCNMNDGTFGSFTSNLGSHPGAHPRSVDPDKRRPWIDVGFRNTGTGKVLPVPIVRRFAWSGNEKVYFAVYPGTTTADVNALFNNTNNGTELPIDVIPTRCNYNLTADIPAGYNASAFNAFTYVYGKGEDYDGVNVGGKSRRRIGYSSRDYNVFTINWWGGAKLEAGSTYLNRGFYFISNLGSVETTAESLLNKIHIDEIGMEQWSPRAVDIYESGGNFEVLAALSAEGTSTACNSMTPVCQGYSTPQSGHVAFFYVTCGTNTYFGRDPYSVAPSFGATFPAHGNITSPVRSYACDGEPTSTRPSWKLMGFFPTASAGCTNLETATYDETICAPSAQPSPHPVPASPQARQLSRLRIHLPSRLRIQVRSRLRSPRHSHLRRRLHSPHLTQVRSHL